MSAAVFWVLIIVCVVQSPAAPVISPSVSPDDQTFAEIYLNQFFSDSEPNVTAQSLVQSRNLTEEITRMQAFFGLEVTGSLNRETLELMRAPRCGVSDASSYGLFPGKPKWEKSLITYRISQYTPDLSRREVDETIGRAFRLYSDVVPLSFKQIHDDSADITILFKGGDHGDFQPFDGPGGVLAHAFIPGSSLDGDAHFDDDEQWTLTHLDTNLLLVAAHEFGHALGLDHSRVKNSLMYPTYQYVNTDGYQLPDDDRRGIQQLYGSRRAVCGPPPPLKNGDFTIIIGVFQYYSRVQYQCQRYYLMQGDPFKTCLNGVWSGGEITCLSPCIVNTDLLRSNRITFRFMSSQKLYAPHSDFVTFQCERGATHDGRDQMRQPCINGQLVLPRCV